MRMFRRWVMAQSDYLTNDRPRPAKRGEGDLSWLNGLPRRRLLPEDAEIE
jgi:hypothetical protein